MKTAKMTNRVLVIALVVVLIGAMLPLGALTGHSQVRAALATIYVPDDYPTIEGAAYAASTGDATTMVDGAYGTTSTYHMLTVDKNGSGTITSNPPGINCGTDCSELYEEGTWVDLTATTDNGWISLGISCDHITDQTERQLCELENLRSGGDRGSTSYRVRVLMDQAKNVTFRFVPGGIIEVSRTGSGTIVSSPRGIGCGCDCREVFFGDPRIVTLTALPAIGATFLGWQGDCSGSGDCTLDTGHHHTDVVARFTEGGQYTLAVNKIGSGTVTSSPAGIDCGSDCSERYEDGTPVTLTFNPHSGWGIQSLRFEGSCTWVDQQLFELEMLRHGGPLPTYEATLHVLEPETVTVYFVPVDTPIARASDISGQPNIMYPNTEYTVTAKYFDPNGREDLKYCYLQLRRPDKPLTMMWVQAIGEFWMYAGEEGENYLTTVSGNATPIAEGGLEGYKITWTFTINDQWPEVENAIDFGVYAWDDSDLKSGWNHDDTKASFKLVVNRPPDLPSELRQFNPWQGVNIQVGGGVGTAIDYNVIVLEAQVSDPDSDKVMLEIEVMNLGNGQVKPLQMDYFVHSGEKAHLFFIAESGNYAWRARAIDEHGQLSDWAEFGDNHASDTDFHYGFEPYPYGYQFTNRAVEPGTLTGGVGRNFPKIWEEYIIEGDNWIILRETFDLEGIDEKTQMAWVKEFMLDGKIFRGCCYGMALSSAMRYVYPELLRSHYGGFHNVIRESGHVIWNLSNPPAADINGDGYAGWLGNDIGTKPVLRAILSFQLSQYGTAAQKAMSDAKDNNLESPAEILDTLSKALPNRGQQMGAMHVLVVGYEIHTKLPLGGTKKSEHYHAVVPYKILDNRIYVYDNNHPDETGDREKGHQNRAYSQYIEIDRAANTWKYNISGSTYWPAQSATISYIGLLSLDNLYSDGQLPKPRPVGTGGNEAVISSTGSGDLLLTDSEGRSTGFEQGWLVEEIPGVRPIYTCNASPEDPGETWRQAYYTAGDTELSATIQGREDGSYSVTRFGPEYFATISDVTIGQGETDELLLSSNRFAIRLYGNQAPKTYILILNKNRDGESQTIAAVSIPIAGSAVHEYTIDWDTLYQGEDGVTVSVDSDGDGEFDRTFTAGSELTGDQFILHTETFIDFDPDVLNLRARSGLVTVYIELPEGFDVNEIDVSSIRLNGTIPALSWATSIGDYNNNGIPDLMVKFDRRSVQAILDVGQSVEITITGEVDGIPFSGTDTIRVIGP